MSSSPVSNLKSFVKTSLLGGLIVLLPVGIFIFVFTWLFQFVTGLIQPLTDLVMSNFDLPEFFADVLVIIVILSACFMVGLLVKTQFGRFIHNTVEERLKKAPGYTLIRDTILQFMGKKKTPFSSVALVQIFGNEALVTAFVTDEHDDGSYTVFVPTGPNPTSGNICHLPAKYVHHLDISVEETMRSIISCGAGSTKLVANYREKQIKNTLN